MQKKQKISVNSSTMNQNCFMPLTESVGHPNLECLEPFLNQQLGSFGDNNFGKGVVRPLISQNEQDRVGSDFFQSLKLC